MGVEFGSSTLPDSPIVEEKSLAKALIRLRPNTPPREGPFVSIVITNRDGETHLRRLLEGLDTRTGYRDFEVVLVDNGSRDRSLQLFERWRGRKRLVANDQNQSFSAANNQGIRAATGDLLLLANNDIEPIHPDWLGYMVQSLEDQVSVVGAMLVYPKRPETGVPPAHPDLSIQHLGACFESSKWGVRGINMAAGGDPLHVVRPDRREVPVVTAACLLARRSDLLATPFDERYWYGSEDWDLCLRLGNLGSVVLDERAILFHHEFGTQDRYMSSAWLEQRTENHIWFNELWGPSLRRRLRAEVTGPAAGWFFRGTNPPTLGLVAGSESGTGLLGAAIAEQAEDAGWNLSKDTTSCDLTIALEPPTDVHWFAALDMSVAVVLGREDEWARSGALDAAKHIVTPDRSSQTRIAATWGTGIADWLPGLDATNPELLSQLLTLCRPRPTAMRIGIATCAPDWERAQFWGDTHLARGLMRAFRRLGHETTELIKEDWQGAAAASCDVVIHLRGLTRRPTARGQWNLLWIISHPDRLEPGEADDYDLVASASQGHAEQLSSELGRTVHFLPQATDIDTFRIGPGEVDYETEVLYVGNARWPNRRAPRWLMRNGRKFDLYGKNWDTFPEARWVRKEYIPNQDLAVAYRSASVVVADHHGSMRTQGFIANRLFDVLASGGFVLSDDVSGLTELFGDVIPTYSDPAELESQLRVLLDEAPHRRELAAKGRRLVLDHHTLDDRARRWLELLGDI